MQIRIRYVIPLLLLLTAASVFAQDDLKPVKKDHSKTDNDVKLSVLPYYNFGRGLGMTSPDSLFQLNIRFRMQNRLEVGDDEGSYIGAYIRRLRLRLDGYVGNPKFLYAIQLSFAPDDVGEIQPGTNLNVIRDAVVFYRPNDTWTFSFGQTKLPGNRQRINSSGALQLTDRSINNAKFNLDRDFGFQVHYLNEHREIFSYNLKGAVTSGNGRNTTVDRDQSLSYTGKVEIYPLGSFAHGGSTFEGDIEREDRLKLLFSGAYQFNQKAQKSQGVLGQELANGESRDQQSVLLDAVLKQHGWALMYAHMRRNAEKPVLTGGEQPSYVYVGYGNDYQLSYLFKNNYEVIGRFSNQKVNKEIWQFTPNQKQYTLGLTKYIWEHAFKLQLEGSLNQFKRFNGETDYNWFTRFQIEMGI